jgi:hypothetical protein
MLEVIGAGLGRTGTHSLGLALEKLGFGPCYNIFEVDKNRGHRGLWHSALVGKPVDWDDLFSAYKSTVEWPGVAFFDQICQHYPYARVILTMREPESWYESVRDTLFEAMELSALQPDPGKRANRGLSGRLMERAFDGRYGEKVHILEVYGKHVQHVKEVVPRERLLQFDVRDGWQPLCDFLQKPVPAEPFPKVNERSDFIGSAPEWAKNIREARRQNLSEG